MDLKIFGIILFILSAFVLFFNSCPFSQPQAASVSFAGLEKENDDANDEYFSSNTHSVAVEILQAQERQQHLRRSRMSSGGPVVRQPKPYNRR